MDKMNSSVSSIDEYISKFPSEIQEKLQTIRQVIKETVPDAQEKISYQMPTFYMNGNLVHFAAFKNHIGFYPTPSGIESFHEDLAKYQTSKGAAQFPLDEALPLDLVRKIVEYRVRENLKKEPKRK